MISTLGLHPTMRRSLCNGLEVPLQNTGSSYAVQRFCWLHCKKMSHYIKYFIWSYFSLVSLSIRYVRFRYRIVSITGEDRKRSFMIDFKTRTMTEKELIY